MTKLPGIPPNYQTVMPYLILPNAAAFSTFTESVFGAKITHTSMRDEHTIMHAEVMIGECTIMFADTTDKIEASPAGLFVYVADADTSFAKALAAGATVLLEIEDRSYGRSGGVLDPFGNSWWITSII